MKFSIRFAVLEIAVCMLEARTKSTKRKRVQKQIASKTSTNNASKPKDNAFELVSTAPKKHIVYGQRGLHYSLAASTAKQKNAGKVNVV